MYCRSKYVRQPQSQRRWLCTLLVGRLSGGRTDLLVCHMMQRIILFLLMPLQFYFERDCDYLSTQTNETLAAHDVINAVVITDGNLTRCWGWWGHSAVTLRKVEQLRVGNEVGWRLHSAQLVRLVHAPCGIEHVMYLVIARAHGIMHSTCACSKESA